MHFGPSRLAHLSEEEREFIHDIFFAWAETAFDLRNGRFKGERELEKSLAMMEEEKRLNSLSTRLRVCCLTIMAWTQYVKLNKTGRRKAIVEANKRAMHAVAKLKHRSSKMCHLQKMISEAATTAREKKDAVATALKRVAAANKAAAHLQMGDTEARWSAEIGDDGVVRFRRLWRGVTDVHEIEAAFLTSAEARKLHRVAGEHAEVYQSPVHLVKGSEDEPEPIDPDSADETDSDAPAIADDSAITLPSQLLDAVMAAGRKGQKVQRYKGLGEMNAEQLWETTLDPDNRALLQVKVEDADVTDEIFTRLMGDIVEPRREFIQDNALNVANLDV